MFKCVYYIYAKESSVLCQCTLHQRMDLTKVFVYKAQKLMDQTYLIKSRSTSSLRGSKKDCLPIVWTLHVLQVFCFSIKLYEVKINSNTLMIVLTIRWDKRNNPLKYFKTIKWEIIFFMKTYLYICCSSSAPFRKQKA